MVYGFKLIVDLPLQGLMVNDKCMVAHKSSLVRHPRAVGHVNSSTFESELLLAKGVLSPHALSQQLTAGESPSPW